MDEKQFKLLQLYFQLHALIADGEGNSDKANAVREQMELYEEESTQLQFQTIIVIAMH